MNVEPLVQPAWVEAHLSDPSLRVFDCSILFTPTPDDPFSIESGRSAWDRGHVPGSDFLDVQHELSETPSPRFTMPSVQQFTDAMSRHGVADGTQVVLYTTGHPRWATRVWWLLRAFGFDNAAVMDGGFQRWVAEGREVSTAPCHYGPAQFVSRPRPVVMAEKAEVLAAIADPHIRLVSALSRKMHSGEGVHYGRPGRIPGSVCVPAVGLVERGTSSFLARDALRAAFTAAQVDFEQRVIAYCGGGIAATCDAFVLHLLGHRDVAVYDGSLADWSSDPSLPMETG